ncbi:YhfC family intramembrane metalloprotease [Clostridium cadaveris]|uniref:YhfC family intramembrane metalloprotease n=1 Tax=Clostridium cadaveris TaxID=1529 RepID=UPI001E3E07FA|nr:YhfC family glutamic-type intramembrane protease [Clostridium cadaveris]UFH65212.1 YhfC family intramembrane metalloprotease [Clostridium cadaveris]
MIEISTFIVIIINLVISFGIPIGLVIYLSFKKKKVIKSALMGAAVFIIFQYLIRVPLLNQVFPSMEWFINISMNPWTYGIFLGLTAGLAEELGRYLAFSTALKGKFGFVDGVAYGIGHGGIEAMLICGVTNINNLVVALSINNGSYLSIGVTEAIKNQFLNTSPYLILMGGIERIFAMIIQIGFSILVLYAVKKRCFKYVVLAVFLHMLVDSPIVILTSVFGVSVIGIEVFIGIMAILSVVWIFKSRRLLEE